MVFYYGAHVVWSTIGVWGSWKRSSKGGINCTTGRIYILRFAISGRMQLVMLLSVVRQRTRARGVVWFGRKQKDEYMEWSNNSLSREYKVSYIIEKRAVRYVWMVI